MIYISKSYVYKTETMIKREDPLNITKNHYLQFKAN